MSSHHSLVFIAAISLVIGLFFGGMITPVFAEEGGAWDSFTEDLADSFSTIGGGIAFVVTAPLPGGLVGTGANTAAGCFDEDGAGGAAKATLHGIGFICNLPKDGLGWVINSGIGIFYGSCTDEDAPLYPVCGGDCQAGFYCTNGGSSCECVKGPTTPGGSGTTHGGPSTSPSLACADASFPPFGQVTDDLRAAGFDIGGFYPVGTPLSEGDEAVLDAWCGLHYCDPSTDFCDSTALCVHEYNTDVKCNCVNQDGSSCGPGEGPSIPPVTPGPTTPTGGPGPTTPAGPGPTTPGGGPTPPWQATMCADAKWSSPYSIDDEVEKWLEGQGQDPSQWHAGPGIVNLVDLFNVLCSTKICNPVTGVSCAAQPTCVALDNLKGCECTPGTDCSGPGVVTPGNGPVTPGGPTTPPGTGPTTPGGGGGPAGPLTGYTQGGPCAGSSTDSTSTIYSVMEAAGVDMSGFVIDGQFDQGAMKDAYCAAKTCPAGSSCGATCVNNSDKEVCECSGGSCGGGPTQGGCEFPDFPDDAGNCVDVTPLPDPGCEFPIPVNGGFMCVTDAGPVSVEPGCMYPDPTNVNVCLDDYFDDDGCDPAVQDCSVSGGTMIENGDQPTLPSDEGTGAPTNGDGHTGASTSSGGEASGKSPVDDFWEKFTHLLGLD